MAGPVTDHGVEHAPHVPLELMDHLPVLAVLLPFLAAPLVVLIGSRRLAWPIAFAAVIGAFVVSMLLLIEVARTGVVSYHMGGWAPPLGIEYRIDMANAFVLVLVSAMAAVILPYMRHSIAQELPKRHTALFYALFLLCFTGLMGVTVTGDAFNIFVFLEISSLSTYVLIALGSYRDRRALTTAYNYLIMGTIGATFFVIGIGFLYMATGTLNLADLAERIAALEDSRTVHAAFGFIVVGIGLKVAMYPLHLWLPNAYTYAPSAVSAFLAATATKVAIYVLLRFLFSVFTPDFAFEAAALKYIIVLVAVMAMFAASFIAIFQNNFKKMLAYSSLAQIGYMLLGIGMLSETALTGSIVHLFNHAITKAALFLAVGAFVLRSGGAFYRDLEGMGRVMPFTSAAVVIGGLSLIGIPGTAGFVSKWLLVQAAFEQGWWWMALLIVASSLLAVIYVWRAIEVIYMREHHAALDPEPLPLAMSLSIWVMAGACIWFGLNTDMTLTAARAAAEALMAGPLPLDLTGAGH
jgi:multicomponent Na+:H+ antiporter subunit D